MKRWIASCGALPATASTGSVALHIGSFMQASNMTLQSTCEPFTKVLKCLQQLTKCMFAMYGVETNSKWARLAIMNKYNHKDAKISGHTDDNQYYQMTSLDDRDMCLISSLSLFAKSQLVDSTFNRFYIRSSAHSKAYNLKLPDMSLTILDGGLYHGVVAQRKHDTHIPRINITFRTPRQDCPDIGEMGIANHNRYYGRPLELLVPKDLNTAMTQKQVNTWKQYCQEENYQFRVTRLCCLMIFESIWDHVGFILGSFWGHFDIILGSV